MARALLADGVPQKTRTAVVEVVRALLAGGVAVDARRTPAPRWLEIVSQMGHFELVRVLLAGLSWMLQ